MANCSFISATEARNIARNISLIWSEICEVQTQILASIDANLYSVIVNNGTPFTATGAILSAIVTAGGTGYDPVVATATIDANGTLGNGAVLTPIVTGTTITGFIITSGGGGTLQSATMAANGSGYSLNDTLTLVGGTGTAATATVSSVGVVDAQTEADYDGAGSNGTFVGGDGVGGTAHVALDILTMSDGSTITVDSVDGNGDIVTFTVLTPSTAGLTTENATITQTASTGTGTAFAMTLGDANQSVFSVSVATLGAYTVAPTNPVSTTVAPAGGSGATLTAVISTGYVPVDVTATVGAPSDIKDTQDETNYDGVAGDGTFNGGADYAVTDTITLSESSVMTVDAVTSVGVITIVAQDETNYDGVASNGTFVGGDGVGGTAYLGADTITMNDGSVITVDTVDGNGDILTFDITTSSTARFVTAATLTQIATSGSGSAFTLTTGTNNETTVGVVTQFTVASPGATPYFHPAILSQSTTTGIGTGFSLTPAGNNINALVGGTGALLTPIEANGAITNVIINVPGTGYLIGAPIIFTHPNGVNAAAQVSAVGGAGEITAITITNAGTGYEQAVATIAVLPPDPAQTPALAFAGIVVTTNGSVTGISIQEGGSGYAELLPTVTVADSTGSGAILTTTIAGGAVTAINVTNGGFDFSATPTLTIVTAVGSSGAGATATATVDINTFGTTASTFNDVLIGQTTDAVISDQIAFVLDYFTSLGYNIRAQTNSVTANTMQWSISW